LGQLLFLSNLAFLQRERSTGTAAEFCARQVGYWAAEALKPGTTTYGDYQTMGLTGTSYQLVLDISEEAKRRCAKAAASYTTTASYNGFPSC